MTEEVLGRGVNDLVGADFQKVAMFDDFFGIAIGEKGIVVRTQDGGNTWGYARDLEY